MLYLLNSFLRGGRIIKKIGFTDNIQNRSNQYISHSPGTEIVSTREGDELLETEIHFWLTYLGFKYDKFKEWFIDSPIVDYVFHISQSKLERLLWKHRKEIFDLTIRHALNRVNKDLSVDFRLFDYLFKKFKGSYTENELRMIQELTKYNSQDYYYFKLIYKKQVTEEEINNLDIEDNLKDFLRYFEELPGFREKMRALCECSLTEEERCIILDQIPITYKNYYLTLGPGRCKALSYDVTRISQEYSDLVLFNKEDLINTIYSVFKEGEKYAMSDIKITLGNIYKSLGYNKSPMAIDLEEYFEIKKDKVTLEDGKRSNAFKLVKKK